MGNKNMHQTPFIVKAVNMHDELVDAIKEASRLLWNAKNTYELSNLEQYDINKSLLTIKKLLIREENADEQ